MDWDPAGYESSHSFVWEYGADLVALLDPQPGERVLDVGCGTGHLAAKIAERGATVLGIDSSPAMIAQARQNFPKLQFKLADLREFRADEGFDAAFSNAALHWILEADVAAASLSAALREDGRLVLEMGARGNIALISAALESQIVNYYPSIGEYAGVLERHGFEVLNAVVFDRPTELAGSDRGMRDWIAMFRPDNSRAIEDVERDLRPALWRGGKWFADYRRLRMMARRSGYRVGTS